MINQDKDKLIETLLKAELTWDQIAKKAHASPNRIKKVQDRLDKSRVPKIKSDRSKAFQMYKQNRTPYDVVIELDISPDDAEKYQHEYWKLTGMADLQEIYLNNEGSIPDVIDFVSNLHARRLTVTKFFERFKNLESIDDMESKKKTLEWNIWSKESRLNVLQHNISIESKKLAELQNTIRVGTDIQAEINATNWAD